MTDLRAELEKSMSDVWNQIREAEKFHHRAMADRPPTEHEVNAALVRGSVEERVVQQEIYATGPFDFGESWVDGSLTKVINSLLAIRNSIPEEYRELARCGIDSTSGYEDSYYAQIEVTYNRPETDEEWAIRKADVERRLTLHAEHTAAAELALYEALKAKFGDAQS